MCQGGGAPGGTLGAQMCASLPVASVVTVALRRSFVVLPPAGRAGGYRPRAFLPSGGVNQIHWTDEGTPLLAQRYRRVLTRHHLELHGAGTGTGTGAGTASSSAAAVDTTRLTYYLDPACPAELQEAVLEGVNWWDDAFQVCLRSL